jgi:hypothetical protein
MPLIEVTDTGTNTMPTPTPRATSPGRTPVPYEELSEAVDSTAGGGGHECQAGCRDCPRGRVSQQVPGDHGADGDGECEREERDAGFERGESEHRLDEDRGEKHRPDEDAGHAEHHRSADTSAVQLPDVRREQRRRRAPFEGQESVMRTPETASPATVRREAQPWVPLAPRA